MPEFLDRIKSELKKAEGLMAEARREGFDEWVYNRNYASMHYKYFGHALTTHINAEPKELDITLLFIKENRDLVSGVELKKAVFTFSAEDLIAAGKQKTEDFKTLKPEFIKEFFEQVYKGYTRKGDREKLLDSIVKKVERNIVYEQANIDSISEGKLDKAFQREEEAKQHRKRIHETGDDLRSLDGMVKRYFHESGLRLEGLKLDVDKNYDCFNMSLQFNGDISKKFKIARNNFIPDDPNKRGRDVMLEFVQRAVEGTKYDAEELLSKAEGEVAEGRDKKIYDKVLASKKTFNATPEDSKQKGPNMPIAEKYFTSRYPGQKGRKKENRTSANDRLYSGMPNREPEAMMPAREKYPTSRLAKLDHQKKMPGDDNSREK